MTKTQENKQSGDSTVAGVPTEATTEATTEVTTEVTTEATTEASALQKKKGSRSFKVKLEVSGPQYGRYNGDSPYQAANKALSEIIRNRVKNNIQTDDNINFFLVESTKSSGKKVHQYLGKRIKLETPVTYSVNNGQVITKEYKNILRKVKKSESDLQGGSVVTEPVATEPVATEPVATEPVVTESVVTEPVVTEPVATESVITEPIVTESVATEPVTTKTKSKSKNKARASNA